MSRTHRRRIGFNLKYAGVAVWEYEQAGATNYNNPTHQCASKSLKQKLDCLFAVI